MGERLSEEDRLKLCLQAERVRRLQAELQNVHVAMQQLQAQAQKTQAEQQAFGEEIKAKYSLTPSDAVNAETGAIVRGADAPLPVEVPQQNLPLKEA